jgi:hypothetical protein
VGELHQRGFEAVEGVDLSPGLIARARQLWPGLSFSVISTPPTLPLPGIQDDQRNRARYEAFAAKYGMYGVFETGDGAVCRHHEPSWTRSLLTGFGQVASREISVKNHEWPSRANHTAPRPEGPRIAAATDLKRRNEPSGEPLVDVGAITALAVDHSRPMSSSYRTSSSPVPRQHRPQ